MKFHDAWLTLFSRRYLEKIAGRRFKKGVLIVVSVKGGLISHLVVLYKLYKLAREEKC